MHDNRFQELKLTGKLPSPKGVGLAILELTQREDVKIEEVAATLQLDPTLTGRVLKMANGSLNAAAMPATTAVEAALRLGLRTVRSVSLGFSLTGANSSCRCRTFAYEEFWSHSIAVATACQALARDGGRVSVEEAFTCGLLSGIGRLALASVHPDAYEKVLARAHGGDSRKLAEAEDAILGVNHRDLADAMLRDWSLPESFAEAVRASGDEAATEALEHESSRQMARTLATARDIARAMLTPAKATPGTCRDRARELAGVRRALGLDESGFARLWNHCRGHWQEWCRTMAIADGGRLDLGELLERAEAADAQRAPVAAGPAGPDGGAQRASPEFGVLVVAPASPAVTLLLEALRAAGYPVRHVSEPRAGLASVLDLTPRVVIAWDAGPETPALAMIRTLRQSAVGRGVHAILLRDTADEGAIVQAFDAGVDDLLPRRTSPRIVVARVRTAERMIGLRLEVERLLAESERQVAANAVLLRRLEVAALTDPLTQLHNRRYATSVLLREQHGEHGARLPLSVVLIDVDRFKSVNDAHGHDAGDIVLQRIADALRRNVRRGDAACRIGGEEFLLICPSTPLRDASVMAERLRCAVAEQEFTAGTFKGRVTISLGVAAASEPGWTVDGLLKSADTSVYAAKQAGRNRVVTSDALPVGLARAG